MTSIFAFADNSPSAIPVAQIAGALGELLGVQVESISEDSAAGDGPSNADGPPNETAARLLHRITEVRPVLAVLGTRAVDAKPDPIGHVALEVLSQSTIPLVLVPPGARDFPATEPRILLPLDAASTTDEAVIPIVHLLSNAGAEVLPLHVFTSESLPPFIDSVDDVAILAEEFHRRHVPGASAPCELRIGDPAIHIVQRAAERDVDAVLVAWSQDFTPGRAHVLRQLLREVNVPIVVVPT